MMELWNTRKLKAPPTYTYQAKIGEVDITHLATTLQDGITFYKEQYLLNLETALLARIVYRMKRKFRNSKDFQTLEKVKKDLMIFLQIDINKKLELLLSILPRNVNHGNTFLPTKNMMDFILVRLQGVGKILCRVVQMCKLTAEYYECRVHLGHFWRLALVAIGLVSRIYILSLNIIKFTCLLYLRLLPFSHKLKNSGAQWLPEDYTFPKDLKEWLNVEWSEFDEVIEIPDKEFDISLIDLVEDSDDDVEFCNEYIELDEDEDVEIIEEFKRINKRIKPIDYENSVTILRGFSSDHIDTGEIVSSAEESEEENEIIPMNPNEEEDSPAPLSVPDQKKDTQEALDVPEEEIDVGELISSLEEVNESSKIVDVEEICSKTDIDICKEGHEKVSENNNLESNKKYAELQIETNVLISSSDEELIISSSNEEDDMSSNDSVEFVEEVAYLHKRLPLVTSDFISLNTANNRFRMQDNRNFPKGISRKLSRSRKKRTINKDSQEASHSSVKREQVKLLQNSVKLEKIKPTFDHKITQIGSTPIKIEKNMKIENKNSSVIELILTPEKSTNKNISKAKDISDKPLQISVRGRKRKIKRSRTCRSAKKLRSENTTLNIADLSREIRNCNEFSENHNTLDSSSCLEMLEISQKKTGGKENINNNLDWNESPEMGEHSFCGTIENTSTPFKKRRILRNKNKKKQNSISFGNTTVSNTSQSKRKSNKFSNVRQRTEKSVLVKDSTKKKVNGNVKHSNIFLKTKNNAAKKTKNTERNNSRFSNCNKSSDSIILNNSGNSIKNTSKRKRRPKK